jgi:hypothetical protein
MKPSPSGLAPVAGYVRSVELALAVWCHRICMSSYRVPFLFQLSERLLVLPAFQDPEQPPRTMPVSPLGKRIRYNIKEYEPVSVWAYYPALGLRYDVKVVFSWRCSYWIRVI